MRERNEDLSLLASDMLGDWAVDEKVRVEGSAEVDAAAENEAPEQTTEDTDSASPKPGENPEQEYLQAVGDEVILQFDTTTGNLISDGKKKMT